MVTTELCFHNHPLISPPPPPSLAYLDPVKIHVSLVAMLLMAFLCAVTSPKNISSCSYIVHVLQFLYKGKGVSGYILL